MSSNDTTGVGSTAFVFSVATVSTGAVVATVVAALLFGSREEEQDTKEVISPIVSR